MSVPNPLSVRCAACLAAVGEPCIATSSDLPREVPHRLRGLATASALRRCSACGGSGWAPSDSGPVAAEQVGCTVCGAAPGASCTEAGKRRQGDHPHVDRSHVVRERAAGLGLARCGECDAVGWVPGEPSPWGCDWPRPVIHVDPAVRFGQPMIRGVSCEAYAGMVAGGEAADVVADEYGVTRAEVLLSCWWMGMEGPPRWRKHWRGWAEGAHREVARGEYDKVEDPPEWKSG